MVVLHDASGQPLPLGSTVRIEGVPGWEALVGYDGETYLDALDSGENRLRIQTTTGTCTAHFDYLADEGAVPRIGPLICAAEPSP